MCGLTGCSFLQAGTGLPQSHRSGLSSSSFCCLEHQRLFCRSYRRIPLPPFCSAIHHPFHPICDKVGSNGTGQAVGRPTHGNPPASKREFVPTPHQRGFVIASDSRWTPSLEKTHPAVLGLSSSPISVFFSPSKPLTLFCGARSDAVAWSPQAPAWTYRHRLQLANCYRPGPHGPCFSLKRKVREEKSR